MKVCKFNCRYSGTIQNQTFVGQSLWFTNKNVINEKYVKALLFEIVSGILKNLKFKKM